MRKKFFLSPLHLYYCWRIFKGPEMLMNLFNTLQYGLKSMQLA